MGEGRGKEIEDSTPTVGRSNARDAPDIFSNDLLPSQSLVGCTNAVPWAGRNRHPPARGIRREFHDGGFQMTRA